MARELTQEQLEEKLARQEAEIKETKAAIKKRKEKDKHKQRAALGHFYELLYMSKKPNERAQMIEGIKSSTLNNQEKELALAALERAEKGL